MNWDAISAVGELVSGLAVLITLIYLALQIRQNTAQAKATSHHAISDSLNQINILLGQSQETSTLWLEGTSDRSSLSDARRWQFDSILRAYFHVCETMYFQSRVGTGDEGIVLAEEKAMKIVATSSGGGEWWDDNPYGFSVEFRSYVDELIVSDTALDKGGDV